MLSDVSDENNAYMVYFVSFLGTLAVLPGNIVSALLMDKIGRLRMLGNPRSPTLLSQNDAKLGEESKNISLFRKCCPLASDLPSV